MAGSTPLYPPLNHPIYDPQTGLVTRPWSMFFLRMQSANSGNAPADAEYIVGAVNALLTSERVATNSTSNTWNLATPGQAKVERAALTGDVTASANSNTTTLANSGVTPGTYGDATHVPQVTFDAKGRATAASNVAISTGTVTTTGSPASGNLTKFSGATSITNGDLSGDVTTAGTLVTTLANTAVTPGTYGDSGHVPQYTVDSKGRLTFAQNVAISYWVPSVDGSEPPNFITDGAGDLIFVAYP